MIIENPTANEIAIAILRERNYQDSKWGTIEDHPHTPREWLAIMESELEEAKQAWVSQSGDLGCLHEMLQIIAVGVACLEQHGIVEREEPTR